jgi:hypothetical protein
MRNGPIEPNDEEALWKLAPGQASFVIRKALAVLLAELVRCGLAAAMAFAGVFALAAVVAGAAAAFALALILAFAGVFAFICLHVDGGAGADRLGTGCSKSGARKDSSKCGGGEDMLGAHDIRM